MKKFLLLIVCIFISVSMKGATLVKDGQPVSAIVLDRDAVRTAKFAAAELQYHLKLMTGAEIPILQNAAGVKGVKIFVGESPETRKLGLKYDAFQKQEYVIDAGADRIFLLGRDRQGETSFDYRHCNLFPRLSDEQGTCYAVYDFLERLGVRWYLATETGIVYDKTNTLDVPAVKIRRTPSMRMRRIYAVPIAKDFSGGYNAETATEDLSSRETELWRRRMRHGGEDLGASHSLYSWYWRFWEKMKGHEKEFVGKKPELFAQGYGDKRPGQLCYTNPVVIAQAAKDIQDYFDGKNPDAWKNLSFTPLWNPDAAPLVPSDNSLMCKCAECQKQIRKEARRGKGLFSNDQTSDYIFGFINGVARKVAESYPDKKVAVLAYARYAYPPEGFKPESNLLVQLCLHSRLWGAAPAVRDNDLAILRAWGKDVPKTVWLYYCFPSAYGAFEGFESFPGFFAGQLKNQFELFEQYNIDGFFIEPSYRLKNCFNALNDQLELYLTSRRGFDRNVDFDVLTDEFFARYYGKAGDAMKRFYQIAEAAFNNPANNPANISQQEISWKYRGSDATMKQLEDCMREAEVLTKAQGGVYRERFEIFDRGMWQKMLKGKERYKKMYMILHSTMQQGVAPELTVSKPGDPRSVNWEKAGVLSGFLGLHGEKIDRKMNVAFAHDGEWLYLRYRDPLNPAGLVTAPTYPWQQGVEVFFGKQRGQPYYWMEIGHTGEWSGLCFNGIGEAWKSGVNVVSDKSGRNEWNLYLAIPLKELGLKAGDTLYFNLLRNRDGKNEAAWIPTFAGHQAPFRFGEVYLEK